jgi:hypothetical protein
MTVPILSIAKLILCFQSDLAPISPQRYSHDRPTILATALGHFLVHITNIDRGRTKSDVNASIHAHTVQG